MTSLAAQLAQNASLNSALLVDRSRRKPRESYLFTGRDADSHDLDSLHALGVNGLTQLSSLEPSLRTFEDPLFSEWAKSTDRTLLSTEANTQLNKTLAKFLPLLGEYLLESPSNKILEWLVRRFRINEFNIEDVLALFLPYHETPHFAKMLSILHIKPNSTWSFLLPFKSAAQSVSRSSLVTEMVKNTDVARFITSLLPTALKHKRVYRALVTFNAFVLGDFISRSKKLDEGTVAYLLPAIMEPLQAVDFEFAEESILGSYLLLARFSQKVLISPAAIKKVVSAMVSAAEHTSTRQFVLAIVAVLSPQERQDRFSEKVAKRLLRLPSMSKEMRDAVKLVGFEQLAIPLLSGLTKIIEDDIVQQFISNLLTWSDTPVAVLERVSTLLLQHAVSPDTPQAILRPLLYSIYQRHPNILRAIGEKLGKDDESIRSAVQSLVISLSLESQGLPSTKSSGEMHDMIPASTSAESNVRAMAVKELIETLSKSEVLSAPEQESIHSALMLRVQDTDADVLEALYEKPDVVAPLLLSNAHTYIDTLMQSLCSSTSKPKRNILKAHLSFLAAHFTVDKDVLADVFHKLFFPFLLFSKPRQHTAEMVWDIIEHDMPDAAESTYELLRGCAAIVREEKNGESIEMMARINMKVAEKMARNIMKSNDFTTHFESLVTKLRAENHHIQIFAHLIMHSLIKQLSGEHQVYAVHEVLQMLDRDGLANIGSLSPDSDNILASMHDVELAKHAAVKPNSKNTLHWIQLAMVATVPSLTAPGIMLDWTADLDYTPMDIRGRRYIKLMRTVYYVANMPSSSPALTMALLRMLFSNLKDNSLAFLAGIWSGADKNAKEDEQLCVVALQHASAFLQAHVDKKDGVDYQTILPLLLIPLSSPCVSVRQAAMACLSQLQALAEHPFVSVYKFDAIYGANQGQLQYLDRGDLKQYLASLRDEGDHLIHDHAFLRLFHELHLRRAKSDKRKEYEYKHRVHCYLLSHVRTLSVPTAQVTLLRILENISDKAKARVLSPIIEAFIAANECPLSAVQEELACLCIVAFDSSIASDLNEAQSTLWNSYVAIVRRYFSSGASTQLQAVISSSLETGLFASLNQERKTILSEIILEVGARDPEMYGRSKKLLASVLDEVPLVIHLLEIFQPTSVDERATKRAKTTHDTGDSIRRFTLLVEILGTKTLPGSLDLISHLLDTISWVAQNVAPGQADVSYVEQLLMSAIESAAEQMTEIRDANRNAIRLDVLVELTRVSDNPQTFHQALLLIAQLSRLSPESILHNIMPIFTFMGSNVFHRDDTYSFKVVQQTIESIVPYMVSSLKQSHADIVDLHIASRDFLRIFTDSANHIPRHRRNYFFHHFVDVLGPVDFLAPVVMLMVAKQSNRIVRQKPEEAQATLALPLAILQHFSPALQMATLTEILYESQRLVALAVNRESTQRAFLGDPRDEVHRRAKALIIFVGIAVGSSCQITGCFMEAGTLSPFVSTLIALASLKTGVDFDDIRQAAHTTLSSALTAMPAASFVSSVFTILESQENNVQIGALGLLGERLPMVADSVRQGVTDTVKKIIDWIRTYIESRHNNSDTIHAAFRALHSIGSSLQPGEESAISEIVPSILNTIRQSNVTTPVALACLVPLPLKLGPRFIPYLRNTVAISVSAITNEVTAEDAHTVLKNLIVAIPTFWGTNELSQIISTFTKSSGTASHRSSQALKSLIVTITKRVPSKALLSSLLAMWPAYQGAPDKIEVGAYFDVLARTLRAADRTLVLGVLRPLTKLFLEAFEITAAQLSLEMESNVISSFKQFVVKLNETAFKPIYRKIYDWAYAPDVVDTKRRATFSRLYANLLDFFKNLMTPYMSFLLQPLMQDLQAFSSASLQDNEYWDSMIDVITKSIKLDDGAYWRDDKLRQISKPLIAQVPICTNFTDEARLMVQDALEALVGATTDDTLLKSINLEILMHARSEEARIRMYALSSSEALWRKHGGKLRGFVAETATFIAECNEDENDLVVKESLRLKDAVESVVGNINDL